MVLSLLFQGKFEEYFAKAGANSPLWLFVHVPKTAGSSLRTELADLLTPSANIHIDHIDPSLPYTKRFDQAVADFIAVGHANPYRFASGHIQPEHVARIRGAFSNVRCFTMLRQPVKRLVSDYRYQRSAMHPTHEEFKKQYPDLASYVEAKEEQDKIARYLIPQNILNKKDESLCVKYLMDNYTFIGLQEMYPLSFRTITTLLGSPRFPQARLRVNEVTDENPIGLTAEIERSIRLHNMLDVHIHEEFSRLFRGIRDDLLAYLGVAHPERRSG